MGNSFIGISVMLALFIVLVGGIICLQICLSKKENKWPGLILPIVFFCFSLIVSLGLTGYRLSYVTKTQTVDETGEVISESVSDENRAQDAGMESDIGAIISTFALCNISTIVLLALYFAFREKKNQKSALEKMSIQDLE